MTRRRFSARLGGLLLVAWILGRSAVVPALPAAAAQAAGPHLQEMPAIPETLRGGFLRFTLTPACIDALLQASVACSQVGLTGMAGCGVLLHLVQGSCP